MLDFEHLDHYELLGLSRGASIDEIKRAYRREIAKYHPDRFANAVASDQTYAVLRSQRINEAYRVLSNPGARGDSARGRSSRRQHQTPTASPPRDHQAELYDQARAHLDGGRPLQAIAALRQLQQINPLYRDSAELLASAKAQIAQRGPAEPIREATDSQNAMPRRTLIIGGVSGILAVAALAAWAIGRAPGTPAATSAAANTAALVPSALPVATFVPTAEPTPTPTPTPTATPRPTATTRPTITPIPSVAPTPRTTELLTAQEPLLVSEDFTSRAWAAQDGNGWSVGYQDGRYRVTADPGVGLIWSYRTGPRGDMVYAVDLQIAGEGGLLLRFADEGDYLLCLIDERGSFRITRARAGVETPLAEGSSPDIATGAEAQNRIEARLQDDTITFFANGRRLASASIPEPTDNPRYGLVVLAGESGAEAFFDNLSIRAATP